MCAEARKPGTPVPGEKKPAEDKPAAAPAGAALVLKYWQKGVIGAVVLLIVLLSARSCYVRAHPPVDRAPPVTLTAPTPAAMEYQASLAVAAAVTNDENGVLVAVGQLSNTGARPVLQVTLEIHVTGPDGKSLTWSQGPVIRTVSKVSGGWLFKSTSVRFNKNAWSAKDGPLLPNESIEVRKKFPINAAPDTAYSCRMTVMDVEFEPVKGH